MSSHPSSINKANAAFGFAEMFGGIIFICGVILAVVGLLSANDALGRHTPGGVYLLATAPGIAVTVLGMIAVLLASIGHTSVVSAEITAELLKLAKGEGKTSP